MPLKLRALLIQCVEGLSRKLPWKYVAYMYSMQKTGSCTQQVKLVVQRPIGTSRNRCPTSTTRTSLKTETQHHTPLMANTQPLLVSTQTLSANVQKRSWSSQTLLEDALRVHMHLGLPQPCQQIPERVQQHLSLVMRYPKQLPNLFRHLLKQFGHS